jgi:hypothetical protein
MLKLYRDDDDYNPFLHGHHHELIWDLDPNITFVNNHKRADAMYVLAQTDPSAQQNQLKRIGYKGPVLLCSLFHTDESTHYRQCVDWWNEAGWRTCGIHTNLNLRRWIMFDHLIYRTQVYFQDMHDDPTIFQNRLWTKEFDPSLFALDDITLSENPKHFLAPMRTYGNQMQRGRLRHDTISYLKDKNGYVSDHENGVYFEPEGYCSESQLLAGEGEHNYFGGGTWMPIANKYYRDSIASIFVETITFGNDVKTITEKTWDPLVKGHFILPYGYRGMIKDLKKIYNIRFPDWIDYSYDDKADWERYACYKECIQKFLDMPIDTVKELWHKDKPILEHNRKTVLSHPVPSLSDKIKDWLNEGQ